MTPRHIEISLSEQTLRLWDAERVIRSYPISTARNGVGTEEGSNKTPTGTFDIGQKIGHEAELGTVFKGRLPLGPWNSSEPTENDLILSRILWLHGREDHNANTRERYIYIHGTNQEHLIGQPASHGCIRMRNEDVADLFDKVEAGTPVRIA